MLSFTDSGCRLPLDIIELIMWELAEDEDVLSLNRCTRACQDFAAICQRYLFEYITLSDTVTGHPPSTLTRQFKSVLDNNPRLARHVRSVNYVNIGRNDCKSTVPVLRRLRYVHTFSLEFNDQPIANQQNWETLPKLLKTSVCYFIQANNIVDLHLRCVANVPVSIFFHMPHLTILTLSNVAVSDAGPAPIQSRKPESNIQLESLTVWGTVSGIRKLLDATSQESKPLLDLRNLDEFTTGLVPPEDMLTIERILSSSNCLESIRIHGFELDWEGRLSSNLTPGSLQTLKTIEMLFLIEFADDPYQHIIHELEQIGGRNVLESLELTINITTDDQCTTEMETWSRLDVVLSQRDDFPYLRHVEVLLITNSFCCDFTQLHASLDVIADLGFPRLTNDRPEVDFSFTIEGNDV